MHKFWFVDQVRRCCHGRSDARILIFRLSAQVIVTSDAKMLVSIKCADFVLILIKWANRNKRCTKTWRLSTRLIIVQTCGAGGKPMWQISTTVLRKTNDWNNHGRWPAYGVQTRGSVISVCPTRLEAVWPNRYWASPTRDHLMKRVLPPNLMAHW
jgi:hypothetical protein